MTDYTNLVKQLRLSASEYESSISDDEDKQIYADAAAAIEALQADMKTYGDTAFKEGYEMGFAAGEARAEKRMEPKRGEWIEEDLDNFRKYKVTCPHCGAWYVGNYDAYVEPWDFNYCPHCGNICNTTNIEYENELKEREKEAMAKMEVQE